ncbi:undecaprenyl-diphosphatase [Thermophagus xiamenensis]|uniref:Undecaprenyl-diphosphatase n=2 Tax=Thermophagus xiamenensis TaxID=385682 RepID=A0A1I2EZA3_9BACT|nr:undecaprenyl-diphosphatase [Thermophagus xiamenensis]
MYFMILYVIFRQQGLKGIVTLLALLLMLVLSDQISTNIFKEGFERFRPSHEPALSGLVDLINGKKGGKYGFVSSHATNSFGLAIFSLLLFRKRWYSIFIIFWALLNSYSRIYMGLHYPGDILGGMILGSLIGWFVFWLYKKISRRFVITYAARDYSFQLSSVSPVIFTGILTIIIVFISSVLLLELM